MMHQGSIKSVPSVPLVWRKTSGAVGTRGGSDNRSTHEDDFEDGRNWALLLLFSAMLSAPLWPALVFLAI